MTPHLRIARPVSDLTKAADMYCRGLRLRILGSFVNHDGFDGVMLGVPEDNHHFEFTQSREHPIRPAPTAEDLAVFYVPLETEWRARCDEMEAAGFKQVKAFNPYWDVRGRTYQDHDGYRVVLQNDEWLNAEVS